MARKKEMTQADYNDEISKLQGKIKDLKQQLKEQEIELTKLGLAKMTQFLKDAEGKDGKSLYDQYAEAEKK